MDHGATEVGPSLHAKAISHIIDLIFNSILLTLPICHICRLLYHLCNFFIEKDGLVGAMSIVYVNYSLNWALISISLIHFVCWANAMAHC
jgi:hypothetical protein